MFDDPIGRNLVVDPRLGRSLRDAEELAQECIEHSTSKEAREMARVVQSLVLVTRDLAVRLDESRHMRNQLERAISTLNERQGT